MVVDLVTPATRFYMSNKVARAKGFPQDAPPSFVCQSTRRGPIKYTTTVNPFLSCWKKKSVVDMVDFEFFNCESKVCETSTCIVL